MLEYTTLQKDIYLENEYCYVSQFHNVELLIQEKGYIIHLPSGCQNFKGIISNLTLTEITTTCSKQHTTSLIPVPVERNQNLSEKVCLFRFGIIKHHFTEMNKCVTNENLKRKTNFTSKHKRSSSIQSSHLLIRFFLLLMTWLFQWYFYPTRLFPRGTCTIPPLVTSVFTFQPHSQELLILDYWSCSYPAE